MGKRGRKSAAELAVASVVEIQPRPVAPSELTDEEAREWEGIVARLPGDWFTRETRPLLVQYCRHIVAVRRVAQLVHEEEQSDDFNVAYWDRLLRTQERQTAPLGVAGDQAAVTLQSRYGPRAADTAARRGGTGPKPWET